MRVTTSCPAVEQVQIQTISLENMPAGVTQLAIGDMVRVHIRGGAATNITLALEVPKERLRADCIEGGLPSVIQVGMQLQKCTTTTQIFTGTIVPTIPLGTYGVAFFIRDVSGTQFLTVDKTIEVTKERLSHISFKEADETKFTMLVVMS